MLRINDDRKRGKLITNETQEWKIIQRIGKKSLGIFFVDVGHKDWKENVL